jgi:putative dimethyl sulfoxide reductase chaperone
MITESCRGGTTDNADGEKAARNCGQPTSCDKGDAVRLAAQADLVLLTCDMLRPLARQAGEFREKGGKHRVVLRSDELVRPEWTTLEQPAVAALLEAACLPPTTKAEHETLVTALGEVIELARAVSLADWSDEYWRLFDTVQACPIYEANWIRRDKGAILGDLAGFYRAFGWAHDAERGDRPDHLLCELEYVSAMLAMASGARTGEQEAVVADALAQFAKLHLHDWLPSFAWQLCEVTQLPYFGAVANWLVRLWESLAASHGWPADVSPGERMVPLPEGENPYECAAGGLVQLGSH